MLLVAWLSGECLDLDLLLLLRYGTVSVDKSKVENTVRAREKNSDGKYCRRKRKRCDSKTDGWIGT